jgi:hypothetical protein
MSESRVNELITAEEAEEMRLMIGELRAALAETLALAEVANEGDPWFAGVVGIDADAVIARAKALVR